ncbi:MAG: TonB-dependent receptor [Vicinamibacterales bacterium]
MRTPSRALAPVLMLCLSALHSTLAYGQGVTPFGSINRTSIRPVTEIAAAVTGQIEGIVVDEAGKPLDGAVISALGGTTAFAVSDRSGQFSLRQLPPGPYLLRAHLQGFLAARSAMVNVRPAASSESTFTLRREGTAAAPRVAEAGMGTSVVPATVTDKSPDGRDESETAWRLRHLKRSVLRDASTRAGIPQDDDWFLTDSFEFLGRAVGTSAKAASALFSDLSLGGQVNLLTTGAFDNPLQLLQLDRTSSVAYFSLGAPVGTRGDWSVRAAMNQNDLSSWMLAGSYLTHAQVPHRYQFGMSYSLQRYEGGNAVALAAVPDAARNVGSVFGFDEWTISRYVTVGYGASYSHYDYLEGPALFSPRLTATFSPTPGIRIRAAASRQATAPGAEEYLPPSRAEYLPPQRTFSPLSRASGFNAQDTQHYEVGVDRVMSGATLGVRAFRERIDNQLVTVFGLRTPDAGASALGHYYVGSAGDADINGVGITLTHALFANVRGSVDYSVANANWFNGPAPNEYAILTRWIPAAVRNNRERIQDLTTSLQTEIPLTATRVVVLYKLNNAFVSGAGDGQRPGLDARFDLQINQALPFMNFSTSQWEMLVAVRSLFHESLTNASAYDELLVVRPPKRIVGGLTVRF